LLPLFRLSLKVRFDSFDSIEVSSHFPGFLCDRWFVLVFAELGHFFTCWIGAAAHLILTTAMTRITSIFIFGRARPILIDLLVETIVIICLLLNVSFSKREISSVKSARPDCCPGREDQAFYYRIQYLAHMRIISLLSKRKRVLMLGVRRPGDSRSNKKAHIL